jgi:hypothetical protein
VSRCRLSALVRHPVERPLPLRAALALAESGTPTSVRVPRGAVVGLAKPTV